MELLILPDYKKIEVENGKRLISVLIQEGYIMNDCCMGNGSCGKCVVQITKGNISPLNPKEKDLFKEDEIKRGKRLACHVNILENMVVIYESMNIKEEPVITQNIIVKDGYSLNKNKSRVGIIVDVGTTNLVVRIVDLDSKIRICEESIENPQMKYGLDVVSRISYASKGRKEEEEVHLILKERIEELILMLCDLYGILNENIEKVFYVGNTTMIYTLLKRPLYHISKGVFHNVNYSGQISQEKKQWILPLITGHVGSDILAGILSLNLYKKDGKYLLVDIGTNGEIVLSVDGKLRVCSTAAGPAFEGANMSCGIKVAKGAIISLNSRLDQSKIDLSHGDKRSTYQSIEIGQHKLNMEYIVDDKLGLIKGICGSAYVDAMAFFLSNQIMDVEGRLQKEYGIHNRVNIYNNNSSNIYISQQDIREFQLAKAAICSGIEVMLLDADIKIEEIDQIYIAGALGSNTNIANMIQTGIIPNIDINKVKTIGNSALDGGEMLVRGLYSWCEIESIAKSFQHIELANRQEFQEKYIECLNFSNRIWNK